MMIDLGFGVVVESLAKAFLIGGRNATNRTTYDPGPLLPGMVTFDFERREWEQLASPWSQWEYGLAEHVAVEDPGYMFAFAGWEREVGCSPVTTSIPDKSTYTLVIYIYA